MDNKIFNTINHTMVLGPSGIGKTMRVVLPYILSIINNGESFIVVDSKNKLLRKVYTELHDNDYEILTINMRNPEESHAWNPLYLPYQYYLNNDMDTCIELLDDLGANIMMDRLPGESTDPFWAISSKNMFVGLAIALFEDPESTEEMINLRSIYYMSSKGFEKFGVTTYIHQYFKNNSDESRALEYMSSILNAPNDTRGSILSVFYQKLLSFVSKTSFWDKLCQNEIDIEHICSSKTALFLIYEDEKFETGEIINVFLRQVYEAYTRKRGHEKSFSRYHFVLDDFTSLKPFDNLPNILTAARERNISFLFSVNSMSLMDKIYGEEITEFICNNCANWIIFKNSEVRFIKKLKEYIELFFDDQASMQCIKKLNTPIEGIALLINGYQGISNQILRIPNFVEKAYTKGNSNFNTSYSIYKIEESVKKKMKSELITKITQGSTTSNNSIEYSENLELNSITKENEPPIPDIDKLVAKIDQRIAELELEEKKKNNKSDETMSNLSKEETTEIIGGLTNIPIEYLEDDKGELTRFDIYDAKQKKMISTDVLFTFEEETGEKYVVYTDNTRDEKGNICLYPGVLKKKGNKVQVVLVKDEKELKRIEVILDELQKEVRKNVDKKA